ncbi:hypothetical protein [Novosphingobium sp.]|uniref:hypothetical protein n=1 Tax=Novosphingobium sp. TaxID=1874826 RepID=UPI00286E3572|nr:hypothetical protein [Novosphingobium sp.]
MKRIGFLRAATILCAPALLAGCKAEGVGAEAAGSGIGAVAAGSDFKPTKAQFIAPAPGKPAKMLITYTRNLDPATQFSQLHINYWAYDAATLPVYYGDRTITCPDAKEPACSGKTFAVEVTAGRLCRAADASKPGQTWPCGTAPSPKVIMHVVTNWIGVKPRDPHMQVDQLTPTL